MARWVWMVLDGAAQTNEIFEMESDAKAWVAARPNTVLTVERMVLRWRGEMGETRVYYGDANPDIRTVYES